MEKMSPRGMAPALLTRMSAWPTASTTERTVSPLEKSAGWISTGTLCRALILSRADSSDSLEREAMCTAQPSLAKAMAQAKPMPRLPPVMRTVLPESFISIGRSFQAGRYHRMPVLTEGLDDQRELRLRPCSVRDRGRAVDDPLSLRELPQAHGGERRDLRPCRKGQIPLAGRRGQHQHLRILAGQFSQVLPDLRLDGSRPGPVSHDGEHPGRVVRRRSGRAAAAARLHVVKGAVARDQRRPAAAPQM